MLLRGLIIALVLCGLVACNRNTVASGQIAKPTVPAPAEKTGERNKLPAIRQFPAELNEPIEAHDQEPRTQAGRAAREKELARRKRIEETGQPEIVASYQRKTSGSDTSLLLLEVLTDNRLRLNTTFATDSIVRFISKAEVSVMPELLRKAAQHRFFQLPDQYPENAIINEQLLDNAVTVFIDWRGREKRIVHISAGPAELLAIEAYFVKLIKETDWEDLR